MMKAFFLDFRGYWLNLDRDLVPNFPGIFGVYRGNFDWVSQRVKPTQLLYLGESSNVGSEVLSFDLRRYLESFLRGEEELLYTYAPLIKDRRQALAAMVFRHRPAANQEFKYKFPYDLTGITVSGRAKYLQVSFVVPDNVAEDEIDELVPVAS